MKQLLYIVAFSTLLFACGNEEESQITSDLINNPITAADSSGVNQDNLPFFEFEEEVKDFDGFPCLIRTEPTLNKKRDKLWDGVKEKLS